MASSDCSHNSCTNHVWVRLKLKWRTPSASFIQIEEAQVLEGSPGPSQIAHCSEAETEADCNLVIPMQNERIANNT